MKYAIVTGGTRGIGKAICRKLLIQGYYVISVYGSDEVSAKLTGEEFEREFPGSFHLLKYDLSDSGNIPSLFSDITKITKSVDVLILNAGKTVRKGIADLTMKEWDSSLNVNLTTPLFLIQKILPIFNKGANIILTGSSMAVFPHSVSLSYGISKSAVHAMVKNLVKFLVPYEVRINCVAPGFVDTEWQKGKSSEMREIIIEKISLKHFACPEDVASVYLFIIDNQYLNGEIISIDGGYSFQ